MGQINAIAQRVIEEITAASGGVWPKNIWRWRRVARRFDCGLRFVPTALLRAPFLRASPRVAYVPRNRQCVTLLRHLSHEIAEACLAWDGTDPCVASVSRHEVASLVEEWAIREWAIRKAALEKPGIAPDI